MPDYKYEGSFPNSGDIKYYEEDQDEVKKEILNAITLLSNFISAESASRTLKKCSNSTFFLTFLQTKSPASTILLFSRPFSRGIQNTGHIQVPAERPSLYL